MQPRSLYHRYRYVSISKKVYLVVTPENPPQKLHAYGNFKHEIVHDQKATGET